MQISFQQVLSKSGSVLLRLAEPLSALSNANLPTLSNSMA
jgi:hypothetical protein